jgi:hypothetical protein
VRHCVFLALLLTVGCGNSTPSPPSVTTPPAPVAITGHENLGWDQTAADASELSNIGYWIYVDGKKSLYSGYQCSTTPTSAGFECKAPLPPLAQGTHSLQLSSYYQSNPDNESALAGPLSVTVAALVTDASPTRSSARSKNSRPTATDESSILPTGTLAVAHGLDRPADLAFTPDNRLFIAERSGRVRVVRDATLLEAPALTLPAGPEGDGAIVTLAIDPAFARTHFVFAIYTAQSRSGELVFTLARFREAGDTLADRIVILDNIPASADPRAVLRFGLDGKLYAAFDDGGDMRLVEDLASFNGKVLRLNTDGTTPDDAPRKSPIWLEGLDSPRGLGWHGATRYLWTATGAYVDAVRWTTSPNALAVVRDDLFVGSEVGLVRAKIDERVPGRIAHANDLFVGTPVRALAIRPDGAVYFATADSIGMMNQ